MNLISEDFKEKVEEIIGKEKDPCKADSKKELLLLQDLLSGDLSVPQKDYVYAYIQECREILLQEDEENFLRKVSQDVKDFVKWAKSRFNNPGDEANPILDREAEAEIIRDEIKNTKGNYTEYDIEYMRRELRNAGFEEKSPAKNEPKAKAQGTVPVTPKPKPKPKPTPTQKQEPVIIPVIIPDPIPEKKVKKPEILESDRSEGFKLANDLVEELNSFITDNYKVKLQYLGKINSKNAYNFFLAYSMSVGDKNNIVQDVFKISDRHNIIRLSDMTRAVEMLLSQAADFGFDGTKEYKNLKDQIEYLKQKIEKNGPKTDPTEDEAKILDFAIKNLLRVMKKEI